jgi:monovalent cation:H+ antiporter-2, CPA2 family
MNAETVRKEKKKGEPIYFGDASHESVLHHACIKEAKSIAILINDYAASGRIIEMARKLNLKVIVIVRTRYLNEMKPMYKLGADEVIPDEFGSSVEVLTRVLKIYQIPTDEIQKIVSDMRIEGYEMLRLLYREPTTLSDLKITLSDILIETFRVKQGSLLDGKTLGESELRKNYGVTAMLVRRGQLTITQVDAQTRLEAEDAVVLAGAQENIMKASTYFTATIQG